ncbi:MAG TPA: CARDB domain-containing protein [Methanospirillum sp.]|nr:CARDB domain-containing protein [Methanospirillum sp.]
MKNACRLILLLISVTALCTVSVNAVDVADNIGYPEYWFQQGVSELVLKNYDHALTLFDRAIAQDPQLAGAWYWRGSTLEVLGRTEEAAESYAKARGLDPLVDNPYRKKVGALADLMVTPVPTPRPLDEEEEEEKKKPFTVDSDIDTAKQEDATGPDMVMYDMQAEVPEGGRQLAITLTIANEGLRPTRDFYITFYGSYTTPVTSSDTPIGYYMVQNLLPETKKTLTGYFPIERIPFGAYYIGGYIDPNNNVMESDEGNNGKSTTTTVDIPEVNASSGLQLGSTQFIVPKDSVVESINVLHPDLVMDSITSSDVDVIPGKEISVTTTVRNAGSADSKQFRLTMYLSKDDRAGKDDIVLGYGDVTDLPAGKAREGTAAVSIPLGTETGPYYLIGVTDSGNVVIEEDEQNNSLVMVTPLEVRAPTGPAPAPSFVETEPDKQPDLIVHDISSVGTGTAGSMIAVNSSVLNQGSSDAGEFNVSFYLTSDEIVTGDDILVGAGIVPDLPANNQTDGSGYAPIPANITPGRYYFGMIIDTGNSVPESNENNNQGSSKNPIVIT